MGADDRCGYLLTGSESDRCIGGRNLMWAFTAKLGNLLAYVNRKAQAGGKTQDACDQASNLIFAGY